MFWHGICCVLSTDITKRLKIRIIVRNNVV